MIEFKTENKPNLTFSLTDKLIVSVETKKAYLREFDKLKDNKEYIVTIKEYSPRRSLSQNSYLWVLLNELATKLNRSKDEIYQSYIRDYGVFEILPIKNEAVNLFKSKWGKNGMGWLCEEVGESKLDGYTKIIAYYGSSTYTSLEMKKLIDAVVLDCDELGISTLAASDIMLLKNDNDGG